MEKSTNVKEWESSTATKQVLQGERAKGGKQVTYAAKSIECKQPI